MMVERTHSDDNNDNSSDATLKDAVSTLRVQLKHNDSVGNDNSSKSTEKQYFEMENEFLNLLVNSNNRSYDDHDDHDDQHHYQSQETSVDLLEDENDNMHDGTVSIASTVLCERKRNEYGMYAEEEDLDDFPPIG